MNEKRLNILRANMQAAKLGKARAALKRIAEYKMDTYEDYDDAFIHMRYLAQKALENMDNVLSDKKLKRFKKSIKGE